MRRYRPSRARIGVDKGQRGEEISILHRRADSDRSFLLIPQKRKLNPAAQDALESEIETRQQTSTIKFS